MSAVNSIAASGHVITGDQTIRFADFGDDHLRHAGRWTGHNSATESTFYFPFSGRSRTAWMCSGRPDRPAKGRGSAS